MSFDIASLTARGSFWDSVSVWLSVFVALGVIMESVSDFKILARWTGLESRHELRETVAKSGLLILILALAVEIVAAIKSHDISEQIIDGLNKEIGQTQEREEKLIALTDKLGLSNKKLEGKSLEQELTLHSLENSSINFEKSVKEQKARDDATLALLKTDEENFKKARNDLIESANKAQNAAKIADKTASDMEKTLQSEREMRQKMHDLITPRSISAEQLASISEKLKLYAGTSVDILQVGETPEITNFRLLIEKSLTAAGWKPISSTAVGSGSFVGMSIGLVDDTNDTDKAAATTVGNALLSVFNKEGVAIVGAGIVKRDNWPGFIMGPPTGVNKAPLRIYIGSKP
jgi:hypothetical protein